MVICLERGADLHMAQLMPLPLTVSCFSKIQIGFIFVVPAHPDSPGKRAVKRVCMWNEVEENTWQFVVDYAGWSTQCCTNTTWRCCWCHRCTADLFLPPAGIHTCWILRKQWVHGSWDSRESSAGARFWQGSFCCLFFQLRCCHTHKVWTAIWYSAKLCINEWRLSSSLLCKSNRDSRSNYTVYIICALD